MKAPFPRTLAYLGIPVVAVAWMLAARLVWEQTVWSWQNGPQMVGFSLMHAGPGLLLIMGFYAGIAWVVATLIAAMIKRTTGGALVIGLLAAYALAWAADAAPYGFWQRTFIEKFTQEQAAHFFTYAAARGDLETVEAFLARGVDIDVQGDYGTALHGASVEGELAVIEFLLARGADVNARNPYGDTPLAAAMEAKDNAVAARALLAKAGGIVVRGSEAHRSRVISEQVRRSSEELEGRDHE